MSAFHCLFCLHVALLLGAGYGTGEVPECAAGSDECAVKESVNGLADGAESLMQRASSRLNDTLMEEDMLEALKCDVPVVEHSLKGQTCAEGDAMERVCTAQCEKGYEPTISKIKCIGGIMTPPTYECKELFCSAPARRLIENEADGETCKEGGQLRHGEVCTPKCLEGYSPTLPQLDCKYGKMVPSLFNCLPNSCAVPEGRGCMEGPDINHGSECTPRCPSGTVPTETSLQCTLGTFEPASFECVKPYEKLGRGLCGGLEPMMEDGEVKRKERPIDCQLECEKQGECNAFCFGGDGDRDIPCLLFHRCDGVQTISERGEDNSDYTCFKHPVAKDCAVPNLPHMDPKGGSCSGDIIKAGHRFTILCEEGYEPTVSDARCFRGELHPDNIGCVESKCMAPSRIYHRDPEGPCEEGATIESGSTCTAQCADGHAASVKTLNCDKGVLTPATFECIPIPGEPHDDYVQVQVPNRIPGLIPPVGAWRGTTQLSRFHAHGDFDAHMVRHFWKGAPCPQEILDHVASGGILWLSIQPHDWKEAASTSSLPWAKKFAGTVKSFAPAKVMVSVGHEPDIHCIECDTDYQYGYIQDYLDMWTFYQNLFKQEGVDNVVWVMDYAGKKNVRAFTSQVLPLWPGDGKIDWLFWNLFQLGGPFDTRNGNFSSQLMRSYSNFETYSAPGTKFTAIPWGLGAWSATDYETTCDQISYLRTAAEAMSSPRYSRFRAAVYFDSKTGIVYPFLRPHYRKYLSMHFFSVNDKAMPHMHPCATSGLTSEVVKGKYPCMEGKSVPNGRSCTTQCPEGYIPDYPKLSCFDGTFRPVSSFTCVKAWPTIARGMCKAPVLATDNEVPGEAGCQKACFDKQGRQPCSAMCYSDAVDEDPENEKDLDHCVLFQECESTVMVPNFGTDDYSSFKCYRHPGALDCQVPVVPQQSEAGLCEEGLTTVAFGGFCTPSCVTGYKPSVRKLTCGLNGNFDAEIKCNKK
mmetsp:Transcript_18777/g.40995  ORF Transcript_18777/g.40995 Transcript_18777/m.40995 type:complete len:976 (-) Transcript_18777:61-2988(-)